MSNKTFKLQITGRVQGVGFRPFIYNLAKANNLNGCVSNNALGVLILVNASKAIASLFLEQILYKKPSVSVILSHSIKEVSYSLFTNFSILPSKTSEQINIPLTPDFSVCKSCKAEIADAGNRRFQYGFTTCVHCGPRYAITTQYPFEREHTALSGFKMCKACKDEYTDPSNRRFHSQTNSCPECGITLKLVKNDGTKLDLSQHKIIERVSKLIAEGNILAIKNTNGYLLCCDAANATIIKKLRLNKHRPNKPFAVLYPSINTIKKEFDLQLNEEKELQSNVSPIVIIKNTKRASIALDVIAPNLNQTGVMLPSSSLVELIMLKIGRPIIATSGNMHGAPIISNQKDAELQLSNVADYYLHHNLEIEFPQDDSVVKYEKGNRILLRRSRGLAPNYLGINMKKTASVLAMGAHLKSTFSFIPNTHIYISQYFGNLDSYEVLERYKSTIEQYKDLFKSTPQTILVDKHPQYQSSILGKALAGLWGSNIVEIQHHKAHFSSVLGEHNLIGSEALQVGGQEKVLGVIWDGTGLGDDANIWGGEFFIYENHRIKRFAHVGYFDWIANDKMAQEPRLSLLCLLGDENKYLIKDKFSDTEWNIYNKTLENNTLKTSSVGRLFDAVASVLHISDINTFEGESAMLLENCARMYKSTKYIDFLEGETYVNIPSKKIINAIIKEKELGNPNQKIAASFIYTLAKSIIKIAQKENINTIVCSGGVFQNSLLISILTQLGIDKNRDIKFNRKLSANDENISFGQLMYFQYIKN